MSGFANDLNGRELVYTSNVDFSGGFPQQATMVADAQLLIGNTAGSPNIRVGTLTSPLGTISIGYSAPNITLDLTGGSTGIDSIHPDSGTDPVVPTGAGLVNILGSGSTTTVGSLNTLTIQLTGLTNHSVLVGAGTTTITKVGPTATIGQVLQSAGSSADPAFSTATYPLTTTINQILYSSATNTITGLATANRGVLTTGTTGIPVITALATDGQIIIGSTAGVPAAATLTAGTGISITNGSNSITLAVNGATVGQTITGNTGGALSPTAGNWNILGTNSAITGYSPYTTGATSTLILNMPGTVKWVVNPTANLGTHTTIQAAITAAAAGDDVLITANSAAYVENLTLKPGVNLVAYGSDNSSNATGNVIISGTCTLSSAGTVTISGIQLQTNSAALLAVTGSAASIVNLQNCYLNCSNNTGITFSAANTSAAVNITNCIGNLGTTGIGLFTHSSTGVMSINYTRFTNTGASTTASTASAGTLDIRYCRFNSVITTSSTSGINLSFTDINSSAINTTCLTVGGSGTSNASQCGFASGTASSISCSSTFSLSQATVSSSNTNALTGAGTLNTNVVTYTGTSFTNNATTQTNSGVCIGLRNAVAPAAGYIGEQMTASASAVSVSSNTAKTITSISLTAGIWDVYGIGAVSPSGVTITTLQTGISTTNNTLTGNMGIDYFQNNFASPVGACSGVIPCVRATLSATTTYYLIITAVFGSGTATANARITATRVG